MKFIFNYWQKTNIRCKNFLIVQDEGNRKISRNVIHYNLQMIIKENMGLTSWKGAPDSKIHKYDVVIAKNEMFKDKLYKFES